MSQIKNLSEGIVLYCKAGDLTVKSEPVSFLSALKKVVGTTLPKVGFELSINLTEDIILYMNPVCLEQLLQNLLANAIKHSSGKEPLIQISGERISKRLFRFCIQNEGIWKSTNIKKIFNATHSSSSEGAGIGLMICKKIVTAYKGKIYAQSSQEEGTRIFFSLPLYALKQVPAA